MQSTSNIDTFPSINKGYNSTFRPNRLSIGLVVPLENYTNSPIPNMQHHIRRLQLAEELGFSAIWLRDIPFHVESFGDAGQTYDPFVYLGLLAGQTKQIALGVASIILPLRHPAHIAKAAASIDVLSEGRLILGIASGDRPEEYPALNKDFELRGKRFRESYAYIRKMAESRANFDNAYGSPSFAMDMLPKPTSGKLPLLITGGSQQSMDWITENGDGWMLYPRSILPQKQIIRDWRERSRAKGIANRPVVQPLYIDLASDPREQPQAIHLGLRLGVYHLLTYLESLQEIGVNHIAFNLRFNQSGIEETMKVLAKEVLVEFHK
ncbi:MAG: LLM class oxidoreductase [Spirochaetota bacterium]